MARTATYKALVLRCRASGEANREVHLLTAEEGIIRATVFGGPKSKLRAHSAPYNSGQIWVYRDPAKDYAKISDFDVHSWRPGLRELYERTMAAGAIAETILATHGGGGDGDRALRIAATALDALETAKEELCSHILVHFMWRWTELLGIQPSLDYCGACGNTIGGILWFSAGESSALCGNCASVPYDSHSLKGEKTLKLNPGCRRWLSVVGEIDPSQVHRYSMDSKSFSEAKALASSVLTGALGKKLGSWDW